MLTRINFDTMALDNGLQLFCGKYVWDAADDGVPIPLVGGFFLVPSVSGASATLVFQNKNSGEVFGAATINDAKTFMAAFSNVTDPLIVSAQGLIGYAGLAIYIASFFGVDGTTPQVPTDGSTIYFMIVLKPSGLRS